MKRAASVLLAFCLIIGLTAGSASAASSDALSAQQTVQAMGIITGDGSGDLNLSGGVTRAQFAKMMIAASTLKDTVSASAKVSPFKDVKYTNWAAAYIQAAVTAGYLSGYTDGTYRPDNGVKLEEAVSAVLKMLGYSATDFSGAFPDAQLAKYAALGLNENVSAVKGQALTRQDCMFLFYNLMSVKNKSGSYYATMLGYTVNSSGEINYSSLVLTNTDGPFIIEDSSWTSSLPFSSGGASVYLNGTASSLSSAETYGVYYFNKSMKTVWLYNNRVTGTYTAAAPNTSAPTSVTVAGNSYTLSTSEAAYAFSNTGSFRLGDTVTLLLDMDGEVAGVLSPGVVSAAVCGVVSATGTTTYTDSTGSSHSNSNVTVVATDGSSYKYNYSGSAIDVGDLVTVTYSGGYLNVTETGGSALDGTVDSAASGIGTYSFAPDVQIIDTTINGSYCVTYPSRLAGIYLSSSNVRYYSLDSAGKINRLILSDVTGDMYKYGILLSALVKSDTTNGLSISGTYKYVIGGVSTSASSSKAFSATSGAVQIELINGSIYKMVALNRITVASVGASYVTASDGTKYTMADNIPVYLYNNDSYTLTTLSAVSASSNSLYGYYDKAISSGGRIRVIIAY